MFEHLNNYFDEDSRAVLKDGVAAWHSLKRHEDWNYWLRVGKAIATAVDIATSVTGKNSGRNFNGFMASCYSKPTYLGEFADMDKSDRSRAARERDEIEKFRAIIGQTRALRLNNPKSVLDAFDAHRRPVGEKKPAAASPFQKTKQELAKALEENEQLKKDHSGDISVSHKDSDANIARTLVSAFGDRWPRIQDKITRLRKG
jgi:hypothetical protein